MQIVIYLVLAVLFLGGLFFFWLPFGLHEKQSKEPLQDAWAVLKAREVYKGRKSTKFLLTFVTDQGQTLQLYARDHEYAALREGMYGKLVWQGRYFLGFNPRAQGVKL